MLILSRKKGQTIMLGNDIEITIVDIQGDQIRVGISAPKQVRIYRKEIYSEIQEENKKAANVSPELFKSLFAGQKDNN